MSEIKEAFFAPKVAKPVVVDDPARPVFHGAHAVGYTLVVLATLSVVGIVLGFIWLFLSQS